MQKTLYLVLAGSLLGSCNRAPEHVPAGAATTRPAASSAATEAAADSLLAVAMQPLAPTTVPPQPEAVVAVVLLRNQELPWVLRVAALNRKLGSPDQIETGTIECCGHFDTPHTDPSDASVYHYGASEFEVYDGQAVMRLIDFRDGQFQAKLDGMLVDSSTTLAQLQRQYPRAARQASRQQTTTETFWVMDLLMEKDVDASWMLKFQHGKLVQLEYFIPS